MPLMDDMGLPLRVSLPMLVDKLNEYGLRERIRVIASGKLITPADVAWALCIGADFITSARGSMFALGCIQALQCNKNTCPTGITTHQRKFQRGLHSPTKAVRVAAEVLATDPRVACLSFIGSARVGRHLRSRLAPGARCALEHGGAAPVLVDRGVDLEQVVPLLAKGGLYHAGQVCVSVQRVYVQ